jgi:hypothetical protein
MEVVGCNRELTQFVRAVAPPGSFAGGLDGGQEKRNEDADDGDHHE